MNPEFAPAKDVLLEVDLPHAPDQVWRAITDADLVGQWLMATGLRAEVGSHFYLPSADQHANAPAVDCEVTEAVPNRKLQWRQLERASDHDTRAVESTVTLQLISMPFGTRLRIVHEEFRQVNVAPKIVALAARRPVRTPKITCALQAPRRAA